MHHPANILDGPTALDLLGFFAKHPVLSFVGFDLWTFDALDGLLCLSDDVGEALSEHEGKSLSMEGLMLLSDVAAKAMRKYRGTLELAAECLIALNSLR